MNGQLLDVWYSLPLVARVFVLLLLVLAAYTGCFVVFLLIRLRSLPTADNDRMVLRSVKRLSRQCENLRQCTTAMFYVFGLTYFLQLRFAFWTLGDSRRSTGAVVIESFIFYFHYAAAVFSLFLLIHLTQWFAFNRIRRITLLMSKVIAG
jgi:hypothetical protein